MMEVICNDRLGKKVRVKVNEDDTIGDLKKLIAAQVGTRPEKIRIQKVSVAATTPLPAFPSPCCPRWHAVPSPSPLLSPSARHRRRRAATLHRGSRHRRRPLAFTPRNRTTPATPLAPHRNQPHHLHQRPSPGHVRRPSTDSHRLPRPPTHPSLFVQWYTIFKDHITLEDYEIHDGMGLEMYYN